MARINLLPWRETQRKRQARDFGVMVIIAVVVTLLGMGYWHWYVQEEIAYQHKRNKFLESEIAAVDKKIKEIKELEKVRAGLIARMSVIQDLQISRPQVVHLFDEVVETLPEGAYLTEMSQRGSDVRFDGRAQSNARVSAYMRGIDASAWIGGANLKVIATKDGAGEGLNKFQLTAKQQVPNAGQ